MTQTLLVTRSIVTHRSWSWRLKAVAMTGAAATLGVAVDVPVGDPLHKSVSEISGDVAVVLIAVTVLAGPMLVAFGRRAPGHLAWRREVGIGAGVLALAHVVCGLRIHMGGDVLGYFSPSTDHRFFGANVTGALSAAAIALALVTSNGPAMRRLGGRRWKRVQHLVLPGLVLALAHVLLYTTLDGRRRVAAATAVLVLAVIAARPLRWRRARVERV